MDAMYFFETLPSTDKSARRQNSEGHLHPHRREMPYLHSKSCNFPSSHCPVFYFICCLKTEISKCTNLWFNLLFHVGLNLWLSY
jgi:hypothetical protein